MGWRTDHPLGGARPEAEMQEDSEEAAVGVQEGDHGEKWTRLDQSERLDVQTKKAAESRECPGSWFADSGWGLEEWVGVELMSLCLLAVSRP